MSATADVLLLGAPVAGISFFLLAGATPRNLAAVVVFEWLLLPLNTIKLGAGVPVIDKAAAVAITLLAGVLVSRPRVFLRWRPHWVDLPMFAWCLAPIASSLSNQLGIYDGMSAALSQTITWGVPYLIGRVLSDDSAFLVALCKALLLGAAAYAPLCLIESLCGPQLHAWIYGELGRVSLEQVTFFGPLGWRSSVFLQSNLELTPLMGLATLSGFWLWRTGGLRKIGWAAMPWLVPMAASATILGKSLGGFCLMVAGGVVLLLSRQFRSIGFLLALSLVGPAYISSRSLGWWSGRQVVRYVADNVSTGRAQSFDFRLVNEDMLVGRALERPAFGWGRWGRAGIYDANGQQVSVRDGMWIFALGDCGLVGLAALYLSLLLPVWLIATRRDRSVLWNDQRGSVVLLAAVAVVLHSIDGIANCMPNPIYYLLAGSLGSLATQPVTPLPVRRHRLATLPSTPPAIPAAPAASSDALATTA